MERADGGILVADLNVLCCRLRVSQDATMTVVAVMTGAVAAIDAMTDVAAAAADAALRAKLGLEDAEVIGFIGSFYDYEGLDDLIAAMPMLAAARPRASRRSEAENG